MLSKYYGLADGRADRGSLEPFAGVMAEHLKAKYSRVEWAKSAPGGTLGIFYDIWLDGKRQFIKTHRPGEGYQENIRKEAQILQALYGDELEIACETIRIRKQEQTFLRMDYLQYPRQSLAPAAVWDCTMDYQKRLSGQGHLVNYCFGEVIRAGWESRRLLYGEGLISQTVYGRLANSISRLEEQAPLRPRVICHGDLSDVNIMCRESDGKIFVVDWEDSLEAFPEYDFLYWATFFSRRPLYRKGFLEYFGIGASFGTDVMALIILVKCGLSYRSGSYIHNRLSFDGRLAELYEKMI